MLKTCHLCTDTFRWPSLPICACKTLDRCPACHFEQLSTPGKFGKCDVCRTERCEVGTLSLIPIVSYFYVWSQVRIYATLRKPERRTWTIDPVYFPRFLFKFWYVVSIICIVSACIFIVPYSSYGSAEGDPPLYWFAVICALWAIESTTSALCFGTQSPVNNWPTSWIEREHSILFLLIVCQWIFVIVFCVEAWMSNSTRGALLLGTFFASRIPGWIVDAVIVLVLRRSQQSSSIYDPPQSAHHSSSNQSQVVSPSVVYSVSPSSSSSESGHVDTERIRDEEQTGESVDLDQSYDQMPVDIRPGD